MSAGKHTPGPLSVRMDGTCTGAWAEIGQECVDPVTGEKWWRELGRTETSHVERCDSRGRRMPGPLGSITEKPDRFVLTDEGQEHIANAHLWAAASDMLAALVRSKKWIEDAMEERGWPRERIENPPEGSHLHAINAAIAKATGSAS
jgi:hypothetical protein